jgi:hypothetical protein
MPRHEKRIAPSDSPLKFLLALPFSPPPTYPAKNISLVCKKYSPNWKIEITTVEIRRADHATPFSL